MAKNRLYGIVATNVDTGASLIITGVYSNLLTAQEVVLTLQSAQRVMRADSSYNFRTVAL